MAERLVELIFHIGIWTAQGVIVAMEASDRAKSQQGSSKNQQNKRLSPITSYPRAVLISSSAMSFGSDCERLVNIAFQTSQTFPSMMRTYADVIEYLSKELKKRYPDEYFHIIISESDGFGLSIDENQYFAEIKQERYQVIIFSTKQNPKAKMDVHDANSQTPFVWVSKDLV